MLRWHSFLALQTFFYFYYLFIYLFIFHAKAIQSNKSGIFFCCFCHERFQLCFCFCNFKDFAVFNWLQQSESCLLKYALRCLCQFLYHYYYQRFQYFSKDQLFSQALFPRRILPNRFLFIWSITSGRGAYSKRRSIF